MPAFRGLDPARKFPCEVLGCTAAFVKRAHLRRHEMTHTQRRDFVCPGCSRAFSRNDSMARHLRRKHPHLYHSPEASSSAAAGTGQTYVGAASADASTSTAPATFATTSSHGVLALRSPFDSSFYSNSGDVQRRADDYRTLPDSLGRQPSYSVPYNQEAVPRSPRSNASAQWRDDSRGPDGPALSHAVASVSVATCQNLSMHARD